MARVAEPRTRSPTDGRRVGRVGRPPGATRLSQPIRRPSPPTSPSAPSRRGSFHRPHPDHRAAVRAAAGCVGAGARRYQRAVHRAAPHRGSQGRGINGRITGHSGRVGLAVELTRRGAPEQRPRRAGGSRHGWSPTTPPAQPPSRAPSLSTCKATRDAQSRRPRVRQPSLVPPKYHQGAPGAVQRATTVEIGLSSRSHPPAHPSRDRALGLSVSSPRNLGVSHRLQEPGAYRYFDPPPSRCAFDTGSRRDARLELVAAHDNAAVRQARP